MTRLARTEERPLLVDTGRTLSSLSARLPTTAFIRGAQRRQQSFRRGRIVSVGQMDRQPAVQKWLPYGLLGFWTTLLIPALYFSMTRNIHASYPLTDWAFFSLCSAGVTLALAPQVLKWWKAEALLIPSSAADSVDGASGTNSISAWKAGMVKFFERQMWGLQLVLSSAMPSLLTFDIISQFSMTLPTGKT